jgi:hypothetical protein
LVLATQKLGGITGRDTRLDLMEIVVEGGRLVVDVRDGVARITTLELTDSDRGEEDVFELLREAARTVREHGVTHLAIEVPEGDEQAAATYGRLGFVPVARTLGVDVDVLERDLERRPRGRSFGSVHVQTDDRPAVERGVRRFVPQLAGRSEGSVVAPPRDGWVAVYDELCDRDPAALRRLTRELSDRLGAVVIAFGVEEGAVARYLLYDRGRLLDEYLSVQEYYGPLPPGEVVALAANPTLVERLTGASRREISAAAVHAETPEKLPPPAETVRALSTAMRIQGADHGYEQARELPDAVLVVR